MTSPFVLEEPHTVAEALELLQAGAGEARLVAGGTGLTPLIRNGFVSPARLVSLRLVAPGLSGVDATGDGGLRIGACATLRTIETDARVARHAPLLREALTLLATVRLRNVATLGGAVALGHPQMDLPPVLVALGAGIRVGGSRGERTIAAGDFFLGLYETALGDDEMVLGVDVPGFDGFRGTYRRVTARTADDWPILGLAVAARVDSGELGDLRVVAGAYSDRPRRVTSVERALGGSHPSTDDLRSAVEDAAADLELHDTPTVGKRYLRHLFAVHLRRALEHISIVGPGADR